MEEDGGHTLINKRPNLVLQYIEHDKPEVLFCGTLLRIFSALLGLPPPSSAISPPLQSLLCIVPSLFFLFSGSAAMEMR